MSPRWKYFFLGYLWSLPGTLIGLALLLVYRPWFWRWSDGCIEVVAGKNPDGSTRIWGKPYSQTYGFLVIYDSVKSMTSPEMRVHERTHVVQGFVGGPLFLIAYVVCFLYNYVHNLAAGLQGGWWDAYRSNPFEEQAYGTYRKSGDYRGLWGGGA